MKYRNRYGPPVKDLVKAALAGAYAVLLVQAVYTLVTKVF
jgi:RsiW-degrading membrane proteinase PrsW (M82 family)